MHEHGQQAAQICTVRLVLMGTRQSQEENTENTFLPTLTSKNSLSPEVFLVFKEKARLNYHLQKHLEQPAMTANLRLNTP